MLLPTVVTLLLLSLPTHSWFGSSSLKFDPPTHAPGVRVADFAKKDLPSVRLNERVVDLMSGMHFDNLLQDTPGELRPPSLVLFEGYETCPDADRELEFTRLAETVFPSRERLLIARYDIDSCPVRAWFKFTPEMDLAERFDVKKCGTVVFVPRHKDCDGFTEWCEYKTDDPKVTKVGCEDFKDKCAPHVLKWDKSTSLQAWVQTQLKTQTEPEISPVFGTYANQRQWITGRDDTTADNELRNYFLVEAFPAFTPLGFSNVPIPKEMNDFLLGFWNRRKLTSRVTEGWHHASTQMSFHEEPTSFVSLDAEGHMRDRLANEIIKPIVEKWSGISPLELTSFYGIREYKQNWLRGHIDRIDTHVLSVTMSLGKLNASNIDQILSDAEAGKLPKWPLEVVAFDGDIYRHEHPAGTMILYESSKLIHGRPYHNKGPPHLGAFCHFKPVNVDLVKAAAWEKVATNARLNQQKNSRVGYMRSTASVEPTNPVFSKTPYGANTGFRKAGEPATDNSDDDEDDGKPKAFSVQFRNDFGELLDLHWKASNGKLRLQGTIASGTEFSLNTFMGHKFVWTRPGSKEKLPKGEVEIEAGSRTYRYGSHTPAEVVVE